MSKPDPDALGCVRQEGLLHADDYSKPWAAWDGEDVSAYAARSGIAHVISQMPRTQFRPGCWVEAKALLLLF